MRAHKRQKNFFNCTEINLKILKKKNHSLWESFPFEQTHLISKAQLDSMTVKGWTDRLGANLFAV